MALPLVAKPQTNCSNVVPTAITTAVKFGQLSNRTLSPLFPFSFSSLVECCFQCATRSARCRNCAFFTVFHYFPRPKRHHYGTARGQAPRPDGSVRVGVPPCQLARVFRALLCEVLLLLLCCGGLFCFFFVCVIAKKKSPVIGTDVTVTGWKSVCKRSEGT